MRDGTGFTEYQCFTGGNDDDASSDDNHADNSLPLILGLVFGLVSLVLIAGVVYVYCVYCRVASGPLAENLV